MLSQNIIIIINIGLLMKKILGSLAISVAIAGCAGGGYAPVFEMSFNSKSVLEIDKNGLLYKVKPGDTLSEIALYHGVSTKNVARLNNIRYPYHIRIGQKVLIAKHRNSSTPKVVGKTYAKVIYKDDKKEEQKAVTATLKHSKPTAKGWTTPAPNGTLTAKYTKTSRGIDLITTDQYVYAAKSGRVEFTDSLRAYGNVMILKHKGAYMSIYSGRFNYLVGVNTQVKAGQKIAKYSSGLINNNLHFEVRKGQVAIDPSKYALK